MRSGVMSGLMISSKFGKTVCGCILFIYGFWKYEGGV